MSKARSLTPSAARLTQSLRDIGYDFPAAVADLIDNSVSAGARRIDIAIEFDGPDSRVLIADDGRGMSANGILEALRFGSRREYGESDLGRYGLGLKTASLSQARSLTVVSKQPNAAGTSGRKLDLDIIEQHDDWLVIDPGKKTQVIRAREMIREHGGTVVLWEKLDRVLPEARPDGGWARRRIEALAARTAEHLSMVFHRFLSGLSGQDPLVISVNGEKLCPWDPFATSEDATQSLPEQEFEILVGALSGTVRLARYVLPSRNAFSSPSEFEKLSGPLKWNRQQGLYIYRGDRLVQWGGWGGLRGIDEHTKLGRAALDFSTNLDPVFQVNVAKMRVSLPAQLRPMLERPIHELCMRADAAYRKTTTRGGDSPRPEPRSNPTGDRQTLGLALRAAAMQAGEYAAFSKVVDTLLAIAPDVAKDLGLE